MDKKYLVVFSLILSCQVYADEIIIQGDGFNITGQQVIDEFTLQPEKMQRKIKNNPEELRKLVDGLYNESAFRHEALKQGLDKDPIVVRKIDFLTRRVLVQELIDQKKSTIKVPDLEPLAKSYYENHPDEFWEEESVKARHILVKADPENKAEKKAMLESLVKRIQEGGDFAEVAKKYSDDPGSASKGGDLGKFGKGRMVKEFEAAAFKLRKKGELSDIFETQYGYHVIELDEYYPKRKLEFSEVKDRLMNKMKEDYINDEIMAWRNTIIDPKKAVVNKEEIEKVINQIGNQ